MRRALTTQQAILHEGTPTTVAGLLFLSSSSSSPSACLSRSASSVVTTTSRRFNSNSNSNVSNRTVPNSIRRFIESNTSPANKSKNSSHAHAADGAMQQQKNVTSHQQQLHNNSRQTNNNKLSSTVPSTTATSIPSFSIDKRGNVSMDRDEPTTLDRRRAEEGGANSNHHHKASQQIAPSFSSHRHRRELRRKILRQEGDDEEDLDGVVDGNDNVDEHALFEGGGGSSLSSSLVSTKAEEGSSTPSIHALAKAIREATSGISNGSDSSCNGNSDSSSAHNSADEGCESSLFEDRVGSTPPATTHTLHASSSSSSSSGPLLTLDAIFNQAYHAKRERFERLLAKRREREAAKAAWQQKQKQQQQRGVGAWGATEKNEEQIAVAEATADRHQHRDGDGNSIEDGALLFSEKRLFPLEMLKEALGIVEKSIMSTPTTSHDDANGSASEFSTSVSLSSSRSHRIVIGYCGALLVHSYFDASSASSTSPQEEKGVRVGRGEAAAVIDLTLTERLRMLRSVAGGSAASAAEEGELLDLHQNPYNMSLAVGGGGGGEMGDASDYGEALLWEACCSIIKWGELPRQFITVVTDSTSLRDGCDGDHHHRHDYGDDDDDHSYSPHSSRQSTSSSSPSSSSVLALRRDFTSDWEVGGRIIHLLMDEALEAQARFSSVIAASTTTAAMKSHQFNNDNNSSNLPDVDGAFFDLLSCVDSFGCYLEGRYRGRFLSSRSSPNRHHHHQSAAIHPPPLTEVDQRLLLAGYNGDTFISRMLVPIHGAFVNVTLNKIMEGIGARTAATASGSSQSPSSASSLPQPQPPLPLLDPVVGLYLTRVVLRAFTELSHTMRSRVEMLRAHLEASESRLNAMLNGGGGEGEGEGDGDGDVNQNASSSALLQGAAGQGARLRLNRGSRDSASNLGIGTAKPAAQGNRSGGGEGKHTLSSENNQRVPLANRNHALSFVLPFGTPSLSYAGADAMFKIMSLVALKSLAAKGGGGDGADMDSFGAEGSRISSRSGSGRHTTAVDSIRARRKRLLPSEREAKRFYHRLIDLTMRSSRLITNLYKQPPTIIVQKARNTFHVYRDSATGERRRRVVTVYNRAPINYSVTYLASLSLRKHMSKKNREQHLQHKGGGGGGGANALTKAVLSGDRNSLEKVANKLLASHVPVFGKAPEGHEGSGILDATKFSKTGGYQFGGGGGGDGSEPHHSTIPLPDAMSTIERNKNFLAIPLYIPPTPNTLRYTVKSVPFLFENSSSSSSHFDDDKVSGSIMKNLLSNGSGGGGGQQSQLARERFMGLGATGTLRCLDVYRSRRLLPTPLPSSSSSSSFSLSFLPEEREVEAEEEEEAIQRDAAFVFDAIYRRCNTPYRSPAIDAMLKKKEGHVAASVSIAAAAVAAASASAFSLDGGAVASSSHSASTNSSSLDVYDPSLEMPIVDERNFQQEALAGLGKGGHKKFHHSHRHGDGAGSIRNMKIHFDDHVMLSRSRNKGGHVRAGNADDEGEADETDLGSSGASGSSSSVFSERNREMLDQFVHCGARAMQPVIVDEWASIRGRVVDRR